MQARTTPDLDQKARAAYLMTSYAMLLAIPLAGPLAAHGIVPDLSIDTLLLAFRAEGDQPNQKARQRVHVRFASSRFWTANADLQPSEGATVLADHARLCDEARRALEDHLHPLVAVLRRKSGLSEGALWRLAGDSIAGDFLEAGRRFCCEQHAKETALAILKRQGSPLANKEMHYFELSLADPADAGRPVLTRTFRARGGCCRYYTAKEGSLCSTCVLRDPDSRDAILLEGMRKRLEPADPFDPGAPQATQA